MLGSCLPSIISLVIFFMVFSGFNGMVKQYNINMYKDLSSSYYSTYETQRAAAYTTEYNRLINDGKSETEADEAATIVAKETATKAAQNTVISLFDDKYKKEIKFMCRDGRTFEGRQDGVLFWIRENQILRRRGLPCYYVAANDTKGKGRTVFTGDHEHFTLEGAKELCQQIMAGEANLGERKARYAAEDAEKERRAVAEATEQAKNFRGRLEAAGISFGKLLELEDAMDDLSLMARNILLGWENGEGFPHE